MFLTPPMMGNKRQDKLRFAWVSAYTTQPERTAHFDSGSFAPVRLCTIAQVGYDERDWVVVDFVAAVLWLKLSTLPRDFLLFDSM